MRRFSQRTRFFALTSFICLAMSWPTPADYRWVAWGAAGLAAFWFVMFVLEDVSRGVRRDAQADVVPSGTPFPPPPFPRG